MPNQSKRSNRGSKWNQFTFCSIQSSFPWRCLLILVVVPSFVRTLVLLLDCFLVYFACRLLSLCGGGQCELPAEPCSMSFRAAVSGKCGRPPDGLLVRLEVDQEREREREVGCSRLLVYQMPSVQHCFGFSTATPRGSCPPSCTPFQLRCVCFLFAWLLVCFALPGDGLSLDHTPPSPLALSLSLSLLLLFLCCLASGRPIYVHVALHCILEGAAK